MRRLMLFIDLIDVNIDIYRYIINWLALIVMCYVNVKILLIYKNKFFRPFQSFLFLILENTPLNAYQKPGQKV